MLRNRLDIWSEGRHGVRELFDQSGEEASRERLKRGLPIPVCKLSLLLLDKLYRALLTAPHALQTRVGTVSWRLVQNLSERPESILESMIG